MHVYCHDCDHWFTETQPDTETDNMLCPYCDGGNWSAYSDDADIDIDYDAGVDAWKEGDYSGK
jgi:Zn finger protein HypA/HybF involved in hydrogenase expression